MLQRTRLVDRLVPFRWVLEPALGLVLFGVWILTGLPADIESALALVFYCAAVALSRVIPAVALGLIWAAVLLELVAPASLQTPFRVVAAVAVLLTVFGVAAHSGVVVRWLAFATAVLLGPAVAYLFTVRGDL